MADLTIGGVAKNAGVGVETIRFYERQKDVCLMSAVSRMLPEEKWRNHERSSGINSHLSQV